MDVFDRSELTEDRILILDFGSQYTQLIARRIRECGVFSSILPYETAIGEIESFDSAGLVLSGGPATVTSEFAAKVPMEVFNLGIPVLGICYGMQTMSAQLGGRVENALTHEYGYTDVRIVSKCPLFDAFVELDTNPETHLDVWMSHGDRVIELPHGFETVAVSDNSPIAAIADTQRHFYGLQFHPEVTHTDQGKRIIECFVHEICGCGSSWQAEDFIESQIRRVREKVGTEKVVLALSGGVDSSVCAALLQRVIGDQLTCIFVDNGLLRLNEAQAVKTGMMESLGVNVRFVDAQERFFRELKGVTNPEAKRKTIGRVFIEIFQEEAAQLTDVKWLAQGTIYPDVIESAAFHTATAKVIKSHHNVGGLPDSLHLKLLEPLRDLFKDEVREIGTRLGLPKEIVYRHPFPGPGLGVRILGEVKQHYAEILRKADAIFLEELWKNDLYYEASQAFAVFLPVKSVGVVGDNRAYEYVVSLRAVQTEDFMTAKCLRIPYELLEVVSSRIVNEISNISRVTYDISSKPPATIEWE